MFLSCDWGTSSLRLRLLGQLESSKILSYDSNQGIATTHNAWKNQNRQSRIDFYLETLLGKINELFIGTSFHSQSMPIIISGMASSSIGFFELPYQHLPVKIDNPESIPVRIIPPTSGFPYPVLLAGGMSSGTDVMRGEETQLLGTRSLYPNQGSALYLFPGTHSKHLTVSDYNLTHIETYMTGEVFELLSKYSILSEALIPISLTEISREAFYSGIDKAVGGNLLNALFQVRINALSKRYGRRENSNFLSGLLIGSELKAVMAKPADQLFITGDSLLTNLYSLAIARLNDSIAVQVVDGGKAIAAGHSVLFNHYRERLEDLQIPFKSK